MEVRLPLGMGLELGVHGVHVQWAPRNWLAARAGRATYAEYDRPPPCPSPYLHRKSQTAFQSLFSVLTLSSLLGLPGTGNQQLAIGYIPACRLTTPTLTLAPWL